MADQKTETKPAVKAEKKQPGKMRFQLLSGHHNQGEVDEQGVAIIYQGGIPGQYDGDILESKTDLAARFNVKGFAPKFRRVPSLTPLQRYGVDGAGSKDDPTDGLDALTVAELREFAAQEEVELGQATSKADIIEVIRLEKSAILA